MYKCKYVAVDTEKGNPKYRFEEMGKLVAMRKQNQNEILYERDTVLTLVLR